MENVLIIWRSHFLLIWLQSTVLSQKLWPRLKFWHWSLCCWVPISCDIDQDLVTYWPIIIYWFHSDKIDHKVHLHIQPSTVWGSKQSNSVVNMLLYDNWSILTNSNCHLSEHHIVKRAPVVDNEYCAILVTLVKIWLCWECQQVIEQLEG